MPQVNRFARLPQDVQREIEHRLVDNGFSEYAALATELQARGYRISKSGLHREGLRIKARVAELRDSHLARVAGFDVAGERGA